MAIGDVRSFMRILEEKGDVHHIGKEVLDGPEIAAVVWEVNERLGSHGPVLAFDRVRGYSLRVIKNLYGSYQRLALALGLPNWDQATFREMRDYVAPLLESKKLWQKPVAVSDAPCQEVVLMGGQATLDWLPILKWHHWDGGPYITFGTVVN